MKNYMVLDKDTKNIIEDLIHVINLVDDDFSVVDSGYVFSDVRFFVQDGCDLIPLWYVRKDVVRYDDGSCGLWVAFRPNLRRKSIHASWLRGSYDWWKIGRSTL